ncbi:MAG: M23 family metallopeptidase [Bacteroides sp.]|nr:M23 family metallopeptidase [Prevotella sp.]MCM1408436.1 M23 family metallopeptidase [Treponema brennaborense]MCM1469402.1 M23 family metallopeptidase [Bacteroides sp.]
MNVKKTRLFAGTALICAAVVFSCGKNPEKYAVAGNAAETDAPSGLAAENEAMIDAETAAEDDAVPPVLTYSVYRVQKGDMIGVLAEQFGITQDTLISVNGIKNTRTIQIGSYLRVPTMPGILYTVRKDGELLENIAEKYNVSAEKCAAVNSLALGPLPAGTTLFVPDAELDWVTRQEINGDLFIKPLKSAYYFSSPFGYRKSPLTGNKTFHNGVDMASPFGTAVYPALGGTVLKTGWDNLYGNYVIIGHHSGYKTLYGHMSAIETKAGRTVGTKTVIGRVGSTGMSTGPHLHFAVFKNNRAINPVNLWK